MKNIRHIFLVSLLVLAGSQCLVAQEKSAFRKDSLNLAVKPIDISEITLQSSELKLRIKQEIHDLISTNAIRRIKAENTSLLYSIDPDLLVSIDPNDVSLGIRDLENRQIKYDQVQRKIALQKTYLTEIIHNVDSLKFKLQKEAERWKMTRNLLMKDSLASPVPAKLNQTISFIDSALTVITVKSNSVLEIVDKTIEFGVKIDAQSAKNKALFRSKKYHLFSSDHPSFFNLNFKTDLGKEFNGSVKERIRADLEELRIYLLANTKSLLLNLFIFGSLIYLFLLIRRKVKINDAGFGFFYKEMLLKVISRPISASIILSLVCTFFIFPDRPPIFREFSFYLIAFPLIHILDILVDRKFRVYSYVYGVLILLYMLLLLFPNDLVLYRMLLLLIAMTEITLFVMLLKGHRINQDLSPPKKGMVYFFVIVHLGLAVIGLISNFGGLMMLTEIVLFAVFNNIFNGLVIFITVLLINGLISTGIDTSIGQRINVFRMNSERIKRNVIRFLNTLATGLWIVWILRNFKVFDSIYSGFKSIFTSKITIGSASFSLDGILIFFVVIYVSVIVSNVLKILLEEDVLSRFSLSKGLPHTLAMMVKYTFITGGFFLAVNAAGIPIDKFTIVLGAMSVGIGFGLQNVFNNLVSGLILLFERPIQLGDTVQVGQLTGVVQSIGLRSSNIKTFEGAEVILPNGQLVSNEVINWTLSDQQRRIEIKVQVAYDSDPQLVQQLLSDILNSHKDVIPEPAPAVFFHEFGESSLNFVLLFWIGDYYEGRRIKSEILFRVFQILKENQIEIPFPQRDLHIRSAYSGYSGPPNSNDPANA